MSVLKTLRDTVAPELNFLYTSPPAKVGERIEPGWAAREHALHTFFVARLFGATADLRSGDFAVLSRFLPPLTSVDHEADHAWCSVNGRVPVDLSMTFQLFEGAPQLRAPIIGDGPNGHWQIEYAEDESVLDEGFGSPNEIIFIEKDVTAHSEESLLKEPFKFVRAPAEGHERAKFGPQIYAQISLHCYQCATGASKSVRGRLKRDEAFAWIADKYPAADEAILKQLSATTG